MKVVLHYDPAADSWYVREGPFRTSDWGFTKIQDLVASIDNACQILRKLPPELEVAMDCECQRCSQPAGNSGWPRFGELPLCSKCLSVQK